MATSRPTTGDVVAELRALAAADMKARADRLLPPREVPKRTSFHNACRIIGTPEPYWRCADHDLPVYRDGIDWLELVG